MTTVTLSQVAPWNARLGNPYRTRWAELGGRRFKVYAEWLNDVWHIEEVDQDGEALGAVVDGEWTGYVDLAFTLAEARVKIIAEVG